MQKMDVTFSIPRELNTELRFFIKQRNLNKFVSNAIRKYQKEEKLKEEYLLSNNDPGQKEAIKDWN